MASPTAKEGIEGSARERNMVRWENTRLWGNRTSAVGHSAGTGATWNGNTLIHAIKLGCFLLVSFLSIPTTS